MVSTSARIFCEQSSSISIHTRTITWKSNNELQDSCLDNHYSQIILPYTHACHKILVRKTITNEMQLFLFNNWEKEHPFVCSCEWGIESVCKDSMVIKVYVTVSFCCCCCLLTMWIRAFSSVKSEKIYRYRTRGNCDENFILFLSFFISFNFSNKFFI